MSRRGLITFAVFLLASTGCGNSPGSSIRSLSDASAEPALTATAPVRGDPGERGYPILVDAPPGLLMVGGQQGSCWTSNLEGNGGAWLYQPGPARWSRLAATAPAQADSAAYDTRTGELIVRFSTRGGGCDFEHLPEPISETWAFDWRRGTWTNLEPVVSPPNLVMASAPIVYDQRADKIILFGGLNLAALLAGDWANVGSSDTWAYDRQSNSWTNMHPANPPAARNAHALAYDERSGRIILFGGNGDTDYDDTWAYDYATNTWTNLAPENPPSPRHYAHLVYDRTTQRFVLYGGLDYSEEQAYAETWVYDPALNQWEQLDPEVSPTAVAWFGMMFSNATDSIVLYGGGSGRGGWLDEVWAFRPEKGAWKRVETR